jgi:hypothetical protein
MAQLAIDFAPGLLEQFPEWMDAVRASVYRCGKPFKAIAADCDMSVSELSRRLAPQGDLPFPLDKLPRLIESTGDTLPVQWSTHGLALSRHAYAPGRNTNRHRQRGTDYRLAIGRHIRGGDHRRVVGRLRHRIRARAARCIPGGCMSATKTPGAFLRRKKRFKQREPKPRPA